MLKLPTKLPEVKFNRNGYEIRTDILGMAKDFVLTDYQIKMGGWENSIKKDEAGNIVSSVSMPEFPGLDKILNTAEKMYAFVSKAQETSEKK
jgi:hypothetical protein